MQAARHSRFAALRPPLSAGNGGHSETQCSASMVVRYLLLVSTLLLSLGSPALASAESTGEVADPPLPQSPEELLGAADQLLLRGNFEEGERLLVDGIRGLGDEIG